MKSFFELFFKKEIYGTIIIILLTFIIYKLLHLLLDKIGIKGKDELEKKKKKTIIYLFKNIIKYILIIFMILALLNLYGINTANLIAGLGIAGVVIGLGLQDVLKDLFSGISIVFDNYFVIGDTVLFDGFTGTVTELGLKTTKIKKYTGEVLIISNRNIDRIINISQVKPTVCLSIPTAYEEKCEKVEKVLTATIEKIKENNKNVSSVEYLGIDEYKDSSINYAIKFSCKRDSQWELKRLFLKEIKKAYEKNNIKIPYNQLEVHNGIKL